MLDVRGWEDDQVRGQVRQVAHTYGVVGLMNEHQLSLGETTTGTAISRCISSANARRLASLGLHTRTSRSARTWLRARR